MQKLEELHKGPWTTRKSLGWISEIELKAYMYRLNGYSEIQQVW
jgi:hypothetical protein